MPLMSSATNAAWLANTVFDGARAFEGVAPDLDLHCERVIRSAHGLNLQPTKTAEEILALALEGISFFPHGNAALHPADVLGRERPDPDRSRVRRSSRW